MDITRCKVCNSITNGMCCEGTVAPPELSAANSGIKIPNERLSGLRGNWAMTPETWLRLVSAQNNRRVSGCSSCDPSLYPNVDLYFDHLDSHEPVGVKPDTGKPDLSAANAGLQGRLIFVDGKWIEDPDKKPAGLCVFDRRDFWNTKEEFEAHLETCGQGIKHDTGKPDLSLVSTELMETLARVREFGSTKYARDNWKQGFKYNRSIAAALRHIFAFKDGEDNDPESGLTHIGHAIASLEHLLYDYIHHKNNDDRK